jgi:hypothetical protein
MSYKGFNDTSPTGPQKDAEIYTIKVGGGGEQGDGGVGERRTVGRDELHRF